MQTVSVVLDEQAGTASWKVLMGGLEMRFQTQDEAESFARTLDDRVSAPHELPAFQDGRSELVV